MWISQLLISGESKIIGFSVQPSSLRGMDLEADATKRRDRLHSISELPVLLFGSLVSLATGSVSTALVAIFHQEEPELIVIACSTILSGLTSFALCLLPVRRGNTSLVLLLAKFGVICIQLVILGTAVYYLNHGRKHEITLPTPLHKNLLVALDSLILSTLFLNGLAIGCWRVSNSTATDDLEGQDTNQINDHEKFIPLKNSSQTLTPGMEFLHTFQTQTGPKHWNFTDSSGSHSSDEHSFPSVVRHKLECLSAGEASPVSILSRKASSVSSKKRSVSGSPKPKSSLISKLRLTRVKSSHHNKMKAQHENDTTNKNINGRYVTRLSTIPDLSRSVLNFMLSSTDNQNSQEKQSRPDKTSSQIMETSHGQIPIGERTPSGQALDLERNAIERINSALLPPCLRVMETPPSTHRITPTESSEIKMSPSICPHDGIVSGGEIDLGTVANNELGGVSDIQMGAYDNDRSANYGEHMNAPQMTAINMWQDSKATDINSSGEFQAQALLPAFDLGRTNASTRSFGLEASSGFSFPSKTYPSVKSANDGGVDKDLDTISALEEYFRDVSIHEEAEEQILQDGLKQDYSTQIITDRVSKDLMRTSTRHSPTKSMISILSAASQQRQTMRNSFLSMSSDAPHLQNSHYITSSNNGMNSVKSSPTKSQRFKRMGKKLSLSNISDTMTNHSFTSDTTGELFGTSRYDHARGRSIDFSYVHNLQSSHSPTKSASGASMNGSPYKDRRNSMVPELAYRPVSGAFSLQNGNSTMNYEQDLVVNTTLSERTPGNPNSSSSESTHMSQGSNTRYPEIVMSEYDRERWNSMLNLKKLDSHGQLKA